MEFIKLIPLEYLIIIVILILLLSIVANPIRTLITTLLKSRVKFDSEKLKYLAENAKLQLEKEKLEDEKFKLGIEQAISVYEHMTIFQHLFGANRLMILEFHNDGTPPDGRNHGYVTVPYETNDSPLEMIRDRYQRFRGYDSYYNKMIKELMENGCYKIPNIDDYQDCFLKHTYKDQGIKTVYIGKIKRIGTVLYYFSIQWVDGFDLEDSSFKSQVPVFIGKLIASIGLIDPKVIARINKDKREYD